MTCIKCGKETDIRKLRIPYEYCEACCPHESDYDTYEGGYNTCHGCGESWHTYDND